MKVKELIEKLQKCDQEKDVEYTVTKEDCDFIGQVDLKEAYKRMREEN